MVIEQRTGKEIYGYQTFFREVGLYLSRLEQYEKSIKFFDCAIKCNPNDKQALLGRSRARARAIHYAGAMEDMNKVLALDPDNLVALADKALVTYLCSKFEESLTQNSRMAPAHQKPDSFVVGEMHCMDAIENCLAERAGRPLRDHFKIIRKLAWKKSYDDSLKKDPQPKNKPKTKRKKGYGTVEPKIAKERVMQESKVSVKSGLRSSFAGINIRDSLHTLKSEDFIVPALKEPYHYKPLQNYTTNIDNYMAERYLDTMYKDKIFLKTFATLPGAMGPNIKGSERISTLANFGYHTVSYKQEMMRIRRPFYFIKYQEAKITGNLEKRQAQELEWMRESAKREADNLLSKLETAYKEKKLRVILDLAQKLKDFCDSKQRHTLPNKDTYLAELYEYVGKGYYQVFRTAKDHTEAQKRYRIEVILGLEQIDKFKSDSVLDFMHETLVDHKKEIRQLEKLLEEAIYPGETCWYFYEVARHYIELNKHEVGRVYLRKCIQKAEDVEYLQWIVTARMLIVKSELMEHLKNDAMTDLKEIEHVSKELRDAKLLAFIKRCHKVVEGFDVSKSLGDQSKLVSDREKVIIKMMHSAELKSEVQHLFNQMSSMPTSRRMNIMPGVALPATKRKGTVRMSIMPTSKDPEVSDRKSQDISTTGGTGAEFMELIQYHV